MHVLKWWSFSASTRNVEEETKLFLFCANSTFNIWRCFLSSKLSYTFHTLQIKLNVYCNCCQLWRDCTASQSSNGKMCVTERQMGETRRHSRIRLQIWLLYTLWLKTLRCHVVLLLCVCVCSCKESVNRLGWCGHSHAVCVCLWTRAFAL